MTPVPRHQWVDEERHEVVPQSAKSCVMRRRQALRRCPRGSAPVTDSVLLLRQQLAEGALLPEGHEQRVVTEAAVAARRFQYPSTAFAGDDEGRSGRVGVGHGTPVRGSAIATGDPAQQLQRASELAIAVLVVLVVGKVLRVSALGDAGCKAA